MGKAVCPAVWESQEFEDESISNISFIPPSVLDVQKYFPFFLALLSRRLAIL